MQFIDESKKFDEMIEEKGLSHGQIALWYALFHKCNRLHWRSWFSVTNSELSSRSGLSVRGINKARNALKQKGLVDFKTNGTYATQYHLPLPLEGPKRFQSSSIVSTKEVPEQVPHYKDVDVDKDIYQVNTNNAREALEKPIPIFKLQPKRAKEE